ncbi:MAG: hypothetical protein KAK00_08870 [Nanoarchaeota archaeon]|nr:hypothetical protein [Nanoarchaeota archaeon]
MQRKSLSTIIEKIKKLLEHEQELSVRQISIKIKSEWKTVNKALELMKSLNTVKERKGNKTKRNERLFSLVKKK